MAAVMTRAFAAFEGSFDWWMQELREVRASIAERYSSMRSPRFQLSLFADRAVLGRMGDATGEQRTFEIIDGQLPALDAVWTAEKPRNGRIELVLADSEVLVFKLQLPPMAEHELNDAVELQLERKLPLSREQLYVDWVVTQKHSDRSRTISVAAVRRARMDQWAERLRAWPWRLGRVNCRDLDGVVRFDLLPRSIQRVTFSFGRREVLLAWFAAGLVVGLGLLTAGQWMYERTSLAKRIEEASAQVAEVRQLRAVLNRESRPLIAIRQLAQAPAAGSALVALSNTLPTDTWLYQTDVRAVAAAAPVITMEGYAPSAATLVQMLEQARQFSSIQLIETSAAESGLNRIKLQAQLQSSAQP